MARKTSKDNSISEGELFAALSRRSNSLNADVCKEVYYGLVKVIVDQFRAGKDIILPGLGKMYLNKRPGRNSRNINTKALEWIPEKNEVAFKVAKPLREYIHSITIH